MMNPKLKSLFKRNMDKQRNSFRKYESKLDRKAKMAERKQFREILERSRLNTETDYNDLEDEGHYDDWSHETKM